MAQLGVNFSGGIAYRGEAPMTGGLVYEALSEPLNPLSRNAGNGSMEISWQTPIDGIVHHYNVFISTESGGNFERANFEPIRATVCRVFDLPFGKTIYSKVAAVDAAGNVGPYSELARDAVCGRARTILRFSGPIGDQIPEGAMFAAAVGDELIAVRMLEEGTITG